MTHASLILFVSLCAYLLGALFYLIFITLIIYRWSFFAIRPENLLPPYWINMGALAITSLAGSRLILVSDSWGLLSDVSAFLKGFTLSFWVMGAWWVPLLAIVGFWKHVISRVPVRYDPQYWSLVFPLGMFTVATHVLSQALQLPFLSGITVVVGAVALGTWSITFIGMARSLGVLVAPLRSQKGRR
jgi:tellurite resistance protein TehA-like permease